MEASGSDPNVRKRFKMTLAPTGPLKEVMDSSFIHLFICLFIEIYNNRINIYLEYILEKT